MFKYEFFASQANLQTTDLAATNSHAIVLGTNDNSYDMRLMLNARGVDVAVISSIDPLTSKISGGMLCDNDVIAAAQALLDYLSHSFDSKSTMVVISSADSYAILLSMIGDRLPDNFLFRHLSPQLVRACSNKILFSDLCNEMGISCPQTFVFNTSEDITAAIESLPYPGIVKPHCSSALPEEVIKKVTIINDQSELATLSKAIINHHQPVLYQELIAGGTKAIVFVGGYRLGKGNFKFFIGKKLLEFPLAGGSTASAQLVWNDDVVGIVKDLMDKLDYEGMFDIEFIYDQKDHQYKVIEINPRIGLWHTISDNGELDIVSAYYKDLLGEDVSDYEPHENSRKWLFPHIYFCSIIEKKGFLFGSFSWALAYFKTDKVSGGSSKDMSVFLRRIRIAIGYVRRLPIKTLLFGRST